MSRCTQARRVRGSDSRRTTTIAPSTTLPTTIRPNDTWIGSSVSLPTFIRTNERPQISESSENWACHGTVRPPRPDAPLVTARSLIQR